MSLMSQVHKYIYKRNLKHMKKQVNQASLTIKRKHCTTATLKVLLITQLPFTKHFFGQLVPLLTPFIRGFYVVNVVTCSCHAGQITLIYVLRYIRVRHLSIDEVVQQTTMLVSCDIGLVRGSRTFLEGLPIDPSTN